MKVFVPTKYKRVALFVILTILFVTAFPTAVAGESIPVTGIELDQTVLILTAGSEDQSLVAKVNPEEATNKTVSWTSSNEDVATVVDGIVSPLGVGVADIMATTQDGDFQAICQVTVGDEAPDPDPEPETETDPLPQTSGGMHLLGGGLNLPLVRDDSAEMTIDYEVNDGYPWAYSEAYSSDGYDAYLAGNSFTKIANVSNISFKVDAPGTFSFDYKVSTPEIGSSYSLLYNVNTPIDAENYKSAKNYVGYENFRGVKNWTNVEFSITVDDLTDEGQATVYIAYLRRGSSIGNDNMVAIANVCYYSGEKKVILNIEGHEYGKVIKNGDEYNDPTNVISYESGDMVSLTAVPLVGNRFYGWVDESNRFLSTDMTHTFRISKDTSLKAVFAPEGYYSFHHNGTFFTAESGSDLWTVLGSANSGDLVVMLENHTMTADVTIPAGVKLYIPYNAEFDEDGNEDGVTTPGSPYLASPKIATPDKTYRTLTIENGATLTINGTVCIGSVIGYPGQNYQGHTSGWHGKIVNAGQIVVNNGGVLDCWGLITGTGTVEAKSGGSVYEPFIVYDFAGGWNTAELYFAQQSPFKQYAMQNIQSDLTMNAGATLYGRCNLWATSMYNKVDIVYLGADGMYELKQNATLCRSYDGSKAISTNSDIGKTTYTFDGGMILNYLSMPILGVAISTENVDFPLSYNSDIVLKSGENNFSGRSKIMPGTTLRVEDGASLTVEKTLFVLDGLIQSDLSGKSYPTTKTLQDAKLSASGQLVVNGTLTVKADAKFGGIIQTDGDSTSSEIVIEAGALVNCLGVQDGAVGEYDVNTSLFDLPARAYIYNSHKDSYSLKRLYPDRTYHSHDASAWTIDSYTMTHAVNCTAGEWTGEIPVVNGGKSYHNWATSTVSLVEARTGSWQSDGIYHDISICNETVYSDADDTRTSVSEIELEVRQGGDIVFTVGTTEDGGGYVYQVFCKIGDTDPVELSPDPEGEYHINNALDEVEITVTSGKLGDMDSDNKINMLDLLLLRRIIAKYDQPTSWQKLVGNTDRGVNGTINMADLLILRRYIARYISEM